MAKKKRKAAKKKTDLHDLKRKYARRKPAKKKTAKRGGRGRRKDRQEERAQRKEMRQATFAAVNNVADHFGITDQEAATRLKKKDVELTNWVKGEVIATVGFEIDPDNIKKWFTIILELIMKLLPLLLL